MKKHRNKYTLLLVCLLLTVAIAVSGTIAYIFTSSNPVVNTFTPVTPGSQIDEEFENNVKSNVVVTNTGEVDSYIRAKVVITWQDGAGNIYPLAPTKDTDYTISYLSVKDSTTGDVRITTDWILSADGFWYYKEPVAAGASTTNLIGEARQIKECEDTNYKLHIEILSQAIQSTPSTAVVEAWKTDTNNLAVVDGKLSVTEKIQDATQSTQGGE